MFGGGEGVQWLTMREKTCRNMTSVLIEACVETGHYVAIIIYYRALQCRETNSRK